MHVRNHRAFQHQRTLRRNHGSHGHNRSDEPLNDDFVLYYSPSMSVGIFTIADLLPRVMHAAVASFIEAAAPDVTNAPSHRNAGPGILLPLCVAPSDARAFA